MAAPRSDSGTGCDMAWHSAGYRAPGLVRVLVEPRTWPAALTLFVLAALIPESVATFNSPPLLLLTRPVVLPFLCAFYGSVGLLVREFIRRRSASWAAALLLGMAAGAMNEGIIAGTWYKTQYPGYAMVGPVDPAVAVGLTVFHALISTILPILLVELMFPQVAGRSWVTGRTIPGIAALLALTVATGFGPAAHRDAKALVLLAVLGVIALAVRLPPGRRPGGTVRAGDYRCPPGRPRPGRAACRWRGRHHGFLPDIRARARRDRARSSAARPAGLAGGAGPAHGGPVRARHSRGPRLAGPRRLGAPAAAERRSPACCCPRSHSRCCCPRR